MDFLQDLDQILSLPKEEITVTQTTTNNHLTNPEEYDWHQTAAEQQDYQALNNEIERDRFTQKTTVTVASGVATLGGSVALGNWALESTYNPQGYLIFSGIIAASLISAGLSGSRIEGKKFYSSPWLLSSVGASIGVVGGTYKVCEPYFNDQQVANKAHAAMTSEIKTIEVKPQQKTPNNLPLIGLGLVGMLVISVLFIRR